MSLPFRFLAAAVLALATTALLPAHEAQAQTRPGQGFVRLEAIESRAPQNEHPAQVGADVLRAALGSVRTGGSVLKPGGTVFDDKELAEIVPNLVALLGKAGPAQDVTFAVFGRHGSFGENSPATVTTGRVFMQGGRLNLILGHVQARHEDLSFGNTLELTPGQRTRRIAQTWSLTAEQAKFMDKRSDWLQFDLAQLAALPTRPAAAAPETRPAVPAPAPAPVARPAAEAAPAKPDAAEARYQDVQSRLKALERLKAEGLITEDEYRERRRAILQSI